MVYHWLRVLNFDRAVVVVW